MLSAFTARPIVELKQRDKSKIESILAHGDRLFVGLNTGSLRIYRVNDTSVSDDAAQQASDEAQDGETEDAQQRKPRVAELLRDQEKFSKYKIDQLGIIKEANILVSLSNTYVAIHDLASYELQEQLTKTKGASAFAVTSNIVKDPSTGVPSIVSRLAVAVKRRLLLWSWHDMELSGETSEIALPNGIRTLNWATGTKLIAGLSSNYVMVNVENEEVTQISGPGSIGGLAGQESGRLGGMGAGMSYIGMGGTVPKPLATRLKEGEMLLAKDINTHFIDTNGNALGRRQIPWAVAPEAIGYSYPYLLSLQDATKGILEVRNPETLNLLQSISLPGANLLQVAQPNISLAHAGKGFLVASDRVIWRMGALNYDSQIDALVEGHHLDEAISLLGMLEDALVRDKEGRLREIKMQKAQELFDAKKYRDSLDLFTEVAAPPERVIKLYPRMIAGDMSIEATEEEPAQTTEQAQSAKDTTKGHKRGASKAESLLSAQKAENPALTSVKDQPEDKSDTASIKSQEAATAASKSDKELKASVRELQAFLADVRRRLKRFFNEDNSLKKEEEVQINGNTEEADRIIAYLIGADVNEEFDRGQRLKETAKLVDTTLFRAHMYATPSLAGSLFRIANFCDPEVVMEKLEETKRYHDLLDFLFGKKLHRQALERLQKFGKAQEVAETAPQLRGPTRTIMYLQNLPPDMVDLILEFAKWPFEEDPAQAMEIFLADSENAERLDRDKVLKFLEQIDSGLAIQYLEHVIDELNDMSPDLHQKLLNLYFERLKDMETNSADFSNLNARFLTLLQESAQYSPAKILGLLPRDDPHFYEARAIVFSKMGQHKQALEIYVFKLKSPAKAEEYCNRVHLTEDTVATKVAPSRRVSTTDPIEEQPSIYHILLNLYLNPPAGQDPMWIPAIELLARHGSRLPASSTLALIPDSLPVKDLEFYFRGRIRAAETIMGEGRIASGLRKVEAVGVQEKLLLGDAMQGGKPGGRSRRVKIDDERVCGVCHKRLGGSVISVFPE